MWTDVLDLNDFYHSSLGQMTVRLLRARLREVWPNVRGENVLGLGYATPFVRPFKEEAERVLAFMPAQQGVTLAAQGSQPHSLVEETTCRCPIARSTAPLVHAIEHRAGAADAARDLARQPMAAWSVAPTRAACGRRWTAALYHGYPYSPGHSRPVARQHVRADARPGRCSCRRFRAGAAHGARRRALRPALARCFAVSASSIGQAALCRRRRAHDAICLLSRLSFASQAARHQCHAQRRGRRSPCSHRDLNVASPRVIALLGFVRRIGHRAWPGGRRRLARPSKPGDNARAA